MGSEIPLESQEKQTTSIMETKEYCVDLDVTFSARMYVYAKDEESARAQAVKLMESDPRYHTRWGAYVNTEVIDVFTE